MSIDSGFSASGQGRTKKTHSRRPSFVSSKDVSFFFTPESKENLSLLTRTPMDVGLDWSPPSSANNVKTIANEIPMLPVLDYIIDLDSVDRKQSNEDVTCSNLQAACCSNLAALDREAQPLQASISGMTSSYNEQEESGTLHLSISSFHDELQLSSPSNSNSSNSSLDYSELVFLEQEPPIKIKGKRPSCKDLISNLKSWIHGYRHNFSPTCRNTLLQI